MRGLAQPPSRFALTDLTLRSLVELERVKAGLDFEPEVLSQLSSALRETSGREDSVSAFRFVEPGYYEPYERLARAGTGHSSPIDRIQSYIKDVSDQLAQVAGGHSAFAPRLLETCITLHQELIQEVAPEDMLDVNEWPRVAENAQAGLGAA